MGSIHTSQQSVLRRPEAYSDRWALWTRGGCLIYESLDLASVEQHDLQMNDRYLYSHL